MPIFLLSRTDSVSWDEYAARVIRAATEHEARQSANEVVGDEGRIWMDVEHVRCEVVELEGPTQIICEDFKAG